MAGGWDSVYSTGTIAIGAGATTVIGTGTLWGPLANSANALVVGNKFTRIISVDDDTHLTIPAWNATAVTAGAAYELVQFPAASLATLQDLTDTVAKMRGVGVFYSVTGTVPDPAWGKNGDYALKTNSGAWQQWLKTGGVWVLQSTPVGINNRGAWSSAATYTIDDVVSRLGTVYLANTTNTNSAPESHPVDWSVFGAQGSQGATWRVASGVPSNGLGVDGDLYLNSANADVYVKTAGAYVLTMNLRGIAGTQLRYGAGAPSNGLGNDGDAYISTDTHFLYGPKAAGVWPAGTSIVGPQGVQGSGGIPGQNGLPGRSLLYGAAAPGPTDGNDGDFWYATGTKVLYGPKAGGAWPAGTSLQGNTGPQGATGQGINPDSTGTLAQRAAFDAQAQGYKYLETDVSPFKLWVKASASSGDWAGPTFIGGQGPVGDGGHCTDSVVQTFDGGHIV